MTTDIKSVTRFTSHEHREMRWDIDGDYVLFTDHERIVEEIGLLWARELVKRDDALAASRAEVEENEKVINVWRGRTQRAEAEVEGLKKDAERYRWLQKQTPYRFGKIQAACVIDAVDTLYFRADEFDAQVDAAMEKGNV